jgi:hypothetical protein
MFASPEICEDCGEDLLSDEETFWCCREPRCRDCDDDHQDEHDLEDED